MAATRLKSESEEVSLLTDEIQSLCNMMKGIVTEWTNLKQWELELKAE